MEKGMNTSLEDYNGLSGNTASSLGWNWVMQEVGLRALYCTERFNALYLLC